MQDFKKLRVWHLAHELSIDVVKALPESAARRVPGLRGQAIRAATSVPWNIAEGCGQGSRPAFLHHLEHALSSVNELEAELMVGQEAEILSHQTFSELAKKIELVRRMLVSLIQTLERRIAEDEERERKEKRLEDGQVDDQQPGTVERKRRKRRKGSSTCDVSVVAVEHAPYGSRP